MSSRHLFALLSCSLAACSGAASLTEAQFISQASTVYCTKVLGCCAGQSGLPTEAACETAFGSRVQAALTSSLAAPNTVFNGTGAASCVSEVSASSCGALTASASTPDCSRIVTGTQANAGACTEGNSCASGLCINIPTDGGTPTGSGKCESPVAANQACPGSVTEETSGDPCIASSGYAFFSGNQAGGYTCACAPVLSNGTQCADGDISCASGYCDQTSGNCAAPPSSATLTATQCSQALSQGN